MGPSNQPYVGVVLRSQLVAPSSLICIIKSNKKIHVLPVIRQFATLNRG